MPVILDSNAGGSMASSGGAVRSAVSRAERDAHDCEVCGGVGKLCFEPEGEMVAVNWVRRGDGRGGYDQVQQYSYVGNGCGSYDKLPVTTYHGWRVRPELAGVAVVVLLLAFVCVITAWMMPLLIADLATSTTTAAARGKPSPATASQSPAAPTTTAALPFDCAVQDPSGWPSAKKGYCCSAYPPLCPAAPAAVAATPVPVLPRPPPVEPAVAPWPPYASVAYPVPVVTPAPLGICNVGGVLEWSVTKREYCCRLYNNGCPDQFPSPPAATAPVLFDCDAGFANRRREWSLLKNVWCCQYVGKGCESSAFAPEPASLTSTGALTNAKSPASGTFATEPASLTSTGAPTSAHSLTGSTWQHLLPNFDCSDGSLAARWPAAQKAWCCDYTGRGCSGAAAPFSVSRGMPRSKTTTAAPKQANASRTHTATGSTTALPWKCEGGVVPVNRWSQEQKTWCCLNEQVGCRSRKLSG